MKADRQARILALITEHPIETQEELADRLVAEGFKVTQATVSRDIRELRLTKVIGANGRQCYAFLSPKDPAYFQRFVRVLQDGFASAETAGNILVIKTVAGMAMAVCLAIDAMNWSEVVGSIAGDDTIMCAIRTTEDTPKVMDKIRKIVRQEE